MAYGKAHYDFAGKVAVVTGGASGIGAEAGRQLREAGATVVVWDLGAGNASGTAFQVDVTEMITYFQVNGVMYYTDPYGKGMGYEDVFTKIEMCNKHFEAVGLGADYTKQFIR